MTDPLDDTSNIGKALQVVGRRKDDDAIVEILICIHKLDAKVTALIQDETAQQKSYEHHLDEGEKRMDYIERDLTAITKIVENAAGFIKGAHIAGAVLLFAMSIFTWVLMEKNADLKGVANTVAIMAQHDSETTQTIKNIVDMQLRDMAVLEKHIVQSDKMMLENSIKIEGLRKRK